MSKTINCKSCGNNFIQNSSAIAACPVCGSNNIAETSRQSSGPVWMETGVIMSFAILLLMFIALFFLPSKPKSMDVYLLQSPDKCLFSILVKQGNKVQNSSDYNFSSDDGKTWQAKEEFQVRNPGKFTIKIKRADEATARFKYQFPNPFTFNPSCNIVVDNPCNCDQLKIDSIENQTVSGNSYILIHSNEPKCPKEYSINGSQGPWSNDSTFPIGKNDKLRVYVRIKGCNPKEYERNPYQLAQKQGSAPVGNLGLLIKNVIAQRNKEEILNFIDNHFSGSLQMPVNVDGFEMTILDYLMDRSINNYNSSRAIRVIEIKRNGREITGITLSEK